MGACSKLPEADQEPDDALSGLHREDWICAVVRQSKFRDHLTLKQYLAAEHLIVTVLTSVQNIPDEQLAVLGAKRRSSARMPYFDATLSCLSGTELELTPGAHYGRAACSDARGDAPSFSSRSIGGNIFNQCG
jgi:hypothetical protein